MADPLQQNFPDLPTAMVDEDRKVTPPWRYFLQTIWNRTGASSGSGVAAPTGSVVAFAGDTVPSGWLLCDGAAYDRNGFAVLFGVIGIIWGSTSTSNFNVPDLRGRFPFGTSGPFPLGTAGGASKVTLSQSNLPNVNFTVTDKGHVHTVTDPGHTHGVTDAGHVHAAMATANNATAGAAQGAVPGNTANAATGIVINSKVTGIAVDSAVTGIVVASGGTATPVSTQPPYAAMQYIIKT